MTSTLQEQLDFFVEFSKWYSQIVNDFKFNREEDYTTSKILSQILDNKSDEWNLERILKKFHNQLEAKDRIIIYGSGPSLEPTVNNLVKNNFNNHLNQCFNIAADGAAVLLSRNKIHIDGIFSDLDGITAEEFYNTDFMIVHAHGDNKDKIKDFKEEITEFKNIIGTSQGEPLPNIINPGGFTDGDRILYFLRSLLLPKHQIYLIGMDFNTLVGKYSKPGMSNNQEASPIKQKKLQYAIQLIDWISQKITNKLFFVNCTVSSDKFDYITLDTFEEILRNK